jgi:hypothetical protein
MENQDLDNSNHNKPSGKRSRPPVLWIPVFSFPTLGAAFAVGVGCTELFGWGLRLRVRGGRVAGVAANASGFPIVNADLGFIFMGGLRLLWGSFGTLSK